MNKYTTLFEQQSYRDALDFFMESLTNEKLTVWDYVILTASSDDQARSYEMQLEYRLERGQIPKRTHYAVLPDPGGRRSTLFDEFLIGMSTVASRISEGMDDAMA